MAIVVMHAETERNFIVVGAGYGSWATDSPGFMGFPDRKEGDDSVIFICDEDGKIYRVGIEEVIVVSVDGEAVSAHLTPPSTEFPG